MIRAMDEFEKLGIDCPNGEPDYPTPTFRMQPCFSPVWDTAQVLSTLGEAGLSRTDPRLVKAADWLLSKEIRYKGDWSHNVKIADPSCWCFFYNNDHQPDVDDTGEVLLALKAVDNPRERYQYEVTQRGDRVGLRDAVQERRMGVVRQGQHQEDLRVDSVCRPQRDDRSADGGHHGPHAGDAGQSTATRGGTSAWRRRSSSFSASRSRMEAGLAAGA